MTTSFLEAVKGRLIVSCQALADEPLHGSHIMARMALAAYQGGAAAIRANTPEDIRAIREAVPLPVIGLYKDGSEGVYITPTFNHAARIAEAGAAVIALDGTQRQRPNGETLSGIIDAVHERLNLPVLADVPTLDEAIQAVEQGADMVSSTLSGYTPYSPQQDGPDVELVRQMVARLSVPVIAEGRIHTPEQARAMLDLGAYAVVVGGAITRPQSITRWFVQALLN